ncbi:monovalent cation/H(+) antiporter subunit G [Thalassotalea mangrovi]|uniref:Monovalent cation/H(+) antiporter subunit G n=1 Tax=Thalassotalea mangrovi TaxID=2572245 RepID=A0A4U1B4Z1_9GAMM|nr:monovalent cation/H(+) antiporter subunit G [Thalassotalea mangrovi]TKB45463.1 monovalent cation/H(+) antiporter subunit G [Thalassotalea mangrovi]
MILETLSTILLISGAFFSLTGAIGLFKFPDFFTRVHAASVTDSIATILIISGLILRTDFDLVAIKLLFILVFLLLTSPTASHALAKSARHGGLLTLAEIRDTQNKDNG